MGLLALVFVFMAISSDGDDRVFYLMLAFVFWVVLS